MKKIDVCTSLLIYINSKVKVINVVNKLKIQTHTHRDKNDINNHTHNEIVNLQIFFPEMNKKKICARKKNYLWIWEEYFCCCCRQKKLIAHNRRKKTIIFKSLMDHSTTYSSIRINRASRFVWLFKAIWIRIQKNENFLFLKIN